MVDDARVLAVTERNAHWAAEIAATKAAAACEIADQVKAALAIEIDASKRMRAAEERLTELAKENATC